MVVIGAGITAGEVRLLETTEEALWLFETVTGGVTILSAAAGTVAGWFDACLMDVRSTVIKDTNVGNGSRFGFAEG
ncbi:MAG: hypothetical protein C0401_03295 [Anaerolinea sp.]|nr:hypothetical protein [Anaerolinea sp.]